MERAGEFLGNVLRRLDRPEAALAWLSSSWPRIVGKALAGHTRPLRCQGDCLELLADGKPWQQQLENMKRELCARINQAWGGRLVCEVRFASGSNSLPAAGSASTPGSARTSREADNAHTPFIRRRP
jgi:predicted nucleic acid-binding Zn ribbon protein